MRQELVQTKVSNFPVLDSRLDMLNYKISLCGKIAVRKFYCKKDPLNVHLLKESKGPFHCEMRYCDCPHCLVQRFARQMKTFDDITDFHGLRNLWHFSLGFESIPLREFKKNFTKYKKRYETVLNRFWEKLNNHYLLDENLKYVEDSQGKKIPFPIKLRAVRVFDFSFKTRGMVFPHYHFGTHPVGQKRIRTYMVQMHRLRKKMIKDMHIKTPFHFEDFGLHDRKNTLEYLSIRAVGMYKYKHEEHRDFRKKRGKGDLLKSILRGDFLFLKDVLTDEEYIDHFYNRAHFVTVGGLPRPLRHGSNITDGIPTYCPIHGDLERSDVRVDITFQSTYDYPPAPPPDFDKNMVVEVVRIN